MRPIDEQTRGQHASELLDNELLKETLAAIEAEVIAQWEQCPTRDKDGKEVLWQLYKTSKKFRAILLGYIETGKLATERLRHIDERRGLLQVIRDRVA